MDYTHDRLKTGFWVQALVRQCDLDGISVFVRRKGDPDAGAVLLIIDRLNGSQRILRQTRTLDGALAWSEAGADALDDIPAYIERQVSFDPDLWVVDIEDPDGKFRTDAKVI